MASPKRKKDGVSLLNRRVSMMMIVIIGIVITVFLLLTSWQYQLSMEHEHELLIKHFQERINYLESLLKEVVSRVQGMRLVAEADLLESRYLNHRDPSLAFTSIEDSEDGTYFHLDSFKAPLQQVMIGSLTGKGSFKGGDPDFYREVEMALSLNPTFRADAEALRGAAWLYYTSKRGFINIYPWVSSKEFRMTDDILSHDFYLQGLPEVNPTRRLFWTGLYIDEYGKGLMTTCAAPVYEGARFLGTVAVDLTVDFLNTVVKDFRTPEGVMMVVSDHDQLLAYPGAIDSQSLKIKRLAAVLPPGLATLPSMRDRIREGRISRIGFYNVLQSHLVNAPWQVIYYEPFLSFPASFVNRLYNWEFLFLVGMIALVILMLRLTDFYFIVPAGKLVRFIMAQSGGERPLIGRDIPRRWRLWFTTVDRTFRENLKLTRQITEQNQELERRVQERTKELEREILERRQKEDALKASEISLRSIFNGVQASLFLHDAQGVIKDVNNTVLRDFQVSREEATRYSIYDYVDPENARNHFPEYWKKTLAGESPVFDWTARRPKDGSLFQAEIALTRIKLMGQELVLATVRNIEERVKAEEERIHRERLQGALETAGAVCHELNQPLTVLTGYHQLMRGDSTKLAKSDLNAIEEQIKRMTEITHKLLGITEYKTRDYIRGMKIIDLDS